MTEPTNKPPVATSIEVPPAVAEIVQRHNLPWEARVFPNGSVYILISRPDDPIAGAHLGLDDGPVDAFDRETWQLLLTSQEPQ